jgi:hypothetical protein
MNRFDKLSVKKHNFAGNGKRFEKFKEAPRTS